MATVTGPKCRLCRREGEKLFLKGERCNTQKCAMTKRNYPPGIAGKNQGGQRGTEFGKQLRAKQKAKRIYGILERQFRKYYEIADNKDGVTGDILLQLLEQRLDNVVYRLGIAPSRRSARQMVSHGIVEVNGIKVTIPSYQVKEGDEISVRKTKKEKKLFEHIEERLKNTNIPSWLHLDKAALKGKILHSPKREEIESTIDVQLIVEYYSR